MTLELDTTGPGIETYRSARFAASINSNAVYVYSFSEAADFQTIDWADGQVVELSWLKFGTDESVPVQVSLADATPITSYEVYPKHLDLQASLAGGVLELTVPPNKSVVVAVNGNTADVLMLFSNPVRDTVPVATTDWTSLAKDIASVNTTTNEIVFASGHSLTDTNRVVVNSTSTLPEGIEEGKPYDVRVVDATTIQLQDGGVTVDITDPGDGTLTATTCSYSDTVNSLYFGPGRHVIGYDYEVGADVDVFLDYGAVVVGGFRMFNDDGITIRGAGNISGEYTTYAVTSALTFSEKAKYITFNGNTDANFATTNSVQGITCFNTPNQCANGGVWSARNCQVISPMHPNTDAFAPARKDTVTYESEVVDCFSYVGDDNLHAVYGQKVLTISGCHAHNTASGVVHCGYNPIYDRNTSYSVTVTDCDLVHRGLSAAETSSIIRCYSDAASSQQTAGFYNVSFTNVRVWGQPQGKVFDLRNHSPVWDGNIRDQAGQIAFWTIDTFSIEQVPQQLSLIQGVDAVRTPHDLTFTAITVAGQEVNADNYDTYFQIGSTVYNLTWDLVTTTPAPTGPALGTFIVEDGSGLSTANSFTTVAYANAYWQNRGAPAAWDAATESQKQDALRQATFYICDVYGAQWRGTLVDLSQALAWPRAGVIDGDDGSSYRNDVVPQKVQDATCELALRVINGTDLLPDLSTGTAEATSSTVSIGPLSISESFTTGARERPEFPAVKMKLRGFLTGYGGSGLLVRMTR